MAKAINVSTKGAGESSITQSAWARRIVFYVLLVILWQVIAMTGIWPDYSFPGPIAVFTALVNGFLTGDFLQASLLSLQRLAIGYGISLVIGVTLGLFLGRSRLLEQTLGSLVLGLAGLTECLLVTIGYTLVGTDRPGNHLCSGDGCALLDYAWS